MILIIVIIVIVIVLFSLKQKSQKRIQKPQKIKTDYTLDSSMDINSLITTTDKMAIIIGNNKSTNRRIFEILSKNSYDSDDDDNKILLFETVYDSFYLCVLDTEKISDSADDIYSKYVSKFKHIIYANDNDVPTIDKVKNLYEIITQNNDKHIIINIKKHKNDFTINPKSSNFILGDDNTLLFNYFTLLMRSYDKPTKPKNKQVLIISLSGYKGTDIFMKSVANITDYIPIRHKLMDKTYYYIINDIYVWILPTIYGNYTINEDYPLENFKKVILIHDIRNDSSILHIDPEIITSYYDSGHKNISTLFIYDKNRKDAITRYDSIPNASFYTEDEKIDPAILN